MNKATPSDASLAAIRREVEPVVHEALHLAKRLVEVTDQLRSLENATSATMDGFKGTIDEIDDESNRRFAITGCEATFEAILFMFDHLASYTGSTPRFERVPLSDLEHLVETFLADNPPGSNGDRP